jgi:putative Mg2+ transporter-C (MgtC) family protein
VGQVFFITDNDITSLVRLFFAFVLGAAVGFERQIVQRPAGLRTHMLVAAGCCCFTLASIYGFQPYGTVDPSRLAAQIITGVGFLGAGTIFRTGSTVKGLTTASSIWITASIGIAVGLGMIVLAVGATVFAWFTLYVLKTAEGRRAENGRSSGEPSIGAHRDDHDHENHEHIE